MDFELSEELKMVQSLARDFTEGRLKPLERDLLGRAADLSDARAALPPEKETALVQTARELGLWGIGVPETLGGAGLGTLAACLVDEELARSIVPFHLGDVSPILYDCDEHQRQKYLRPALDNLKTPCLAILESGGADITRPALHAARDKDDYILNGTKLTYSRPAPDFFALVFAAAPAGVTAFLVDKDNPGFTASPAPSDSGWGITARTPMMLTFKDCRVPASGRLGGEGRAFELGKNYLPLRRIVRGARSIGAAARLLEEAAARALATQTFGKPVSGRPGVQAALAEIAADIRAARLLVYEAAVKADAGKPAGREAAYVKLFTTRLVRRAADHAAHIFNGPPHVAGVSVEVLCRRALDVGLADLALERQRHIVAAEVLRGVKA